MKSKFVVFLRWPEPCFRANSGDLAYLRALLPKSAALAEAKSEREFLRELANATHVIVWYFRPEWYARAPKLRRVMTPAAGRELVAMPPEKGISVHFGGFHGAIMSESVAAFVLAWARGLLLRQPHEWPRTWMGDKCRDVAGSTAAIWGYGKVGRAIGDKLAALGVKVEGYSRHRPLTLAALRALKPDWFILALPSDTGTDNLVGARLLAALPRECVLINVGRGNAVDETALARALRTKKLAGACLDVLKCEPHSKRCHGFAQPGARGSSDAFLRGRVPNALVMPHAAAFSPRYVRACFDELKAEGWLK